MLIGHTHRWRWESVAKYGLPGGGGGGGNGIPIGEGGGGGTVKGGLRDKVQEGRNNLHTDTVEQAYQ